MNSQEIKKWLKTISDPNLFSTNKKEEVQKDPSVQQQIYNILSQPLITDEWWNSLEQVSPEVAESVLKSFYYENKRRKNLHLELISFSDFLKKMLVPLYFSPKQLSENKMTQSAINQLWNMTVCTQAGDATKDPKIYDDRILLWYGININNIIQRG